MLSLFSSENALINIDATVDSVSKKYEGMFE